MNPPNHKAAGRQVAQIYWNAVTKISHATKVRRTENARRIGEAIWRRWHVGYYRWLLKHVRWYFEQETAGRAVSTRYQYWLTIKVLLERQGKRHWLAEMDRRSRS